MTQIEQKTQKFQRTAQQARAHLEHEVASQVTKALAKGQATTAAALTQQQKDLHRLEAQMERLSRQSARRGGFPWGLVLLAGGAYALYRSNPSFREGVQGLLARVNPGAEGNLARAGDAAKDAVSKVMHGDDPRDSVQATGGELRRAGEKAADQAQDKVRDLNDQARAGAQDLKRDAQKTADDLRDNLKRS